MIEKCDAGSGGGRSEIRKLIQLARDGDELALNKLPAALDEAMYRAGGDLEEVSEFNALNLLISAKKGGCREPVEARMEYMRGELAPEGSPFEVKLLASRAVLDWLHVQCWEQISIAFWVGETPKSTKANAKTLEMAQRQMNSAVARYQRSLLALARVKRLSLPVIVGQVNVAVNGPQLNQARLNAS